MKKILSTLLALMFAVAPMTGEIVATFEYVPGTYYPTVIPLPLHSNGVTLSLEGSIGPNGLGIHGTSSLLSGVGPITGIVFQNARNATFSFSSGTGQSNGMDVVWTGRNESVSFTPASSVLVSRIVVYVDDSGNDPGGEVGNGLASLWDLEPGTTYISPYDATVLRQGGSGNRYLYIRDETGYGIIYGDLGQTYHPGDVIPAGWGGTVKFYNGEPELTAPFFGFVPPTSYVGLDPEKITCSQVNHEHWAHFVTIRNATLSADGMTLTDVSGSCAVYNNTFGASLPTDGRPHDFYGIVGSYKSYYSDSTIYQLLPFNMVEIGYGPCCFEDLFMYPRGATVQFECPLTVVYQNGRYMYLRDECDCFTLMYGNVQGGPFEPGDRIIGSATWGEYQGAKQIMPVGEWHLVESGPVVDPIDITIEETTDEFIHYYLRYNQVNFFDDEDSNTFMEDEGGMMLIFNRFGVDLSPVPNEGGGLPCDLNWDNELNVGDLNELIDLILSGTIEYEWNWYPSSGDYIVENYDVWGFLALYRGEFEFYPVRVVAHDWHTKPRLKGDINRDNEVNIADVNVLIDILIGYD